MADLDRVVSFSVSPEDRKGRSQIKKLKDHCKKTGMSFSFLVIQAITAKNKELGI